MDILRSHPEHKTKQCEGYSPFHSHAAHTLNGRIKLSLLIRLIAQLIFIDAGKYQLGSSEKPRNESPKDRGLDELDS